MITIVYKLYDIFIDVSHAHLTIIHMLEYHKWVRVIHWKNNKIVNDLYT